VAAMGLYYAMWRQQVGERAHDADDVPEFPTSGELVPA